MKILWISIVSAECHIFTLIFLRQNHEINSIYNRQKTFLHFVLICAPRTADLSILLTFDYHDDMQQTIFIHFSVCLLAVRCHKRNNLNQHHKRTETMIEKTFVFGLQTGNIMNYVRVLNSKWTLIILIWSTKIAFLWFFLLLLDFIFWFWQVAKNVTHNR